MTDPNLDMSIISDSAGFGYTTLIGRARTIQPKPCTAVPTGQPCPSSKTEHANFLWSRLVERSPVYSLDLRSISSATSCSKMSLLRTKTGGRNKQNIAHLCSLYQRKPFFNTSPRNLYKDCTSRKYHRIWRNFHSSDLHDSIAGPDPT